MAAWTFDSSSVTFDSGAYRFDGSGAPQPPVITENPSNDTVTAPATATFNANATGYTGVQWQISADGVNWTNLTGATSANYTTGATNAYLNGSYYRAVFSNGAGSTPTSAATLTVISAPLITVNPSNASVSSGSTATFTAAAAGYPTPTVQWQLNTGSGFSNILGATSASYTTPPVTTADSGYQYRAVFTNADGSATTSAATLTVVSISISGGRPMQFVFGPGNMVVTPLTDAYGNAIATPSPRRMGAFQEASFDSSAENKMLYGPNQYPLAVGRGKGKAGIKVKAAQVSVDQWNAMYIGQPANQSTGVIAAYIDTAGTAIPASSPYTITAVTTYAAYLTAGTTPVYDYDLGVQDASGNTYTRVATGPTTGQYSLAGGVYTFAAADAGKTVFISFSYTATNNSGAKNTYINVSNIPMGQAPFLQLDLYCQYGGQPLLVTLWQSIASKLSFSTKLDDFAIPDIEFDGFANSTNAQGPANSIYRIAAGQ